MSASAESERIVGYDLARSGALLGMIVVHFDGFRSVFPWTGLLIFGMWLGRQDLRQRGNNTRFLLTAIAVVVVGLAIANGQKPTLGCERRFRCARSASKGAPARWRSHLDGDRAGGPTGRHGAAWIDPP
jgi:uncharacterized membrane protein